MPESSVLRSLAALLRGVTDPDDSAPVAGADTRPARDEHERLIPHVSSGKAAADALRNATPAWARALIAIQQTMLEVLERQYSLPSDDPQTQHFSAVGTTEQTLPAVAAGSVLHALYIAGSGGTGPVTVNLHHSSFPGGVKTIFTGIISANTDSIPLTNMLVRVPRKAYLGIVQTGTVTDLYINALLTRDRETGTAWYKGLH